MREENVTIRRLGTDDYDELLALWQRSGLHPFVLEAGLHSLRPQGRDSRASIARQLASGVQTILGLEIDGPAAPGSAPHPRAAAQPGAALVGAVVVTHDSRKGWINRLAIDPDHR